jgi:hypothetical protein
MISERMMLMAVWLIDARARVTRAISGQAGQGIMEYAILLGGIALVAGAAFYAFNFDFDTMTDEIQSCINFENDCG